MAKNAETIDPMGGLPGEGIDVVPRVVIADSDAAMCARAARGLAATGLAVSVATHAAALREALKEAHHVALVLGTFPDGVSQARLLDEIRADAPTIPVVLLLRVGERPPGGARAAATPYLRKPLEVRQLVAAVYGMLGGRQVYRDFRQALADIAEHSQEHELLLRTTAAICSTVTLPDLLAQLAERVVRALHVTACQVLLLDDRREHLVVQTIFPVRPLAHGLQPGARIPIGALECYQRALGGEVVLVQSDGLDVPFSRAQRAAVLGRFTSGLLVPMVTKRGVVGLLILLEERSWERSPFTARKIHLCQALSTQAAIALENSLLFAEREQSHLATLASLVAALDARERETRAHSWRVRAYTLRLADRLGVPPGEREALAAGALLHDIGKIGISDNILLKPGPLSPAEWVEMRKHPTIGAEILRDLDHPRGTRGIVLHHQEHYDGSGYPQRLAREDIPFGARIFAVADTLDAITSDRPYHRAASFAAAQAEIARHSGTQFDPTVVGTFLAVPLDEWSDIRSTIAETRDEPTGTSGIHLRGTVSLPDACHTPLAPS